VTTPTPTQQPPLSNRDIADVVRRAIREPDFSQHPTTQPLSTQPTDLTLSSGQYMTLGGVVAEVNGTPIYANKVLRRVYPDLHNAAQQMDEQQFEAEARDQIERGIGELEHDELDYAAAERSLDDSDKSLVYNLTAEFSRRRIIDAGGSIEVARRKALAEGDDFDSIVRDQYRTFMIQVYFQRKFGPRVEVGATQMRDYYQQNLESKFTQHAEAIFDLIKIDPAQEGSPTPYQDRQLAFSQAKQAHDRAVAGENFATLFSEYNNDPGLRILTNGTGNMGIMQRGSFSVPEVEDALWKLQPGQVTDVVQGSDGVLYIAKLESRKEGKVLPFEDELVQDSITTTLRNQQLAQLREEADQKLLSQAIVRTDDQMIDTAVDMALLNYQVWRK